MDENTILTRLLAAARARPPGETVPYAFEQRIMARLTGRRMEDNWSIWGKALWRAAAACVALSIMFSVWSTWPQNDASATTLEDAVFAAVEQPNDLFW